MREGPPLRVIYRLTGRGEALRPALLELGRWAEHHLAEPSPPSLEPAAGDQRPPPPATATVIAWRANGWDHPVAQPLHLGDRVFLG